MFDRLMEWGLNRLIGDENDKPFLQTGVGLFSAKSYVELMILSNVLVVFVGSNLNFDWFSHSLAILASYVAMILLIGLAIVFHDKIGIVRNVIFILVLYSGFSLLYRQGLPQGNPGAGLLIIPYTRISLRFLALVLLQGLVLTTVLNIYNRPLLPDYLLDENIEGEDYRQLLESHLKKWWRIGQGILTFGVLVIGGIILGLLGIEGVSRGQDMAFIIGTPIAAGFGFVFLYLILKTYQAEKEVRDSL